MKNWLCALQAQTTASKPTINFKRHYFQQVRHSSKHQRSAELWREQLYWAWNIKGLRCRWGGRGITLSIGPPRKGFILVFDKNYFPWLDFQASNKMEANTSTLGTLTYSLTLSLTDLSAQCSCIPFEAYPPGPGLVFIYLEIINYIYYFQVLVV